MCGIFGYIGNRDAVKIVLNGLKRLEYRGYDSAGIVGVSNGHLDDCKEVGKIVELEKEINNAHLTLKMAIGHTRWATHGKPSKVNAHPQFDMSRSLALVHNGIIENYATLRRPLIEKGVQFISETDTEVIAHLISNFYEGDLLQAVQQTIPLLKGSFAVAVIHKNHPDQIIAFANEMPLVVGIGADESFLSSDAQAFANHTREVFYLVDSEIAKIKADQVEHFHATRGQIAKKKEWLPENVEEVTKGGYEHYTLKEIFDQPQAIRNALLSHYIEEYGSAVFEGLHFGLNELMAVDRILILACGTSLHAGYIGSYLFEEKARLPVRAEISSEFRYKNPVVPLGTFVIAISQSGETADTIAAMREVKAKGGKVLAITNVQGSTLFREADSVILLHAGIEIGVCSTKAFTSQVTILSLLALLFGRMQHMGKQEGQEFISGLKALPEQVQKVLDGSSQIEAIAKKYAHYDNFFFLGRQYMFPASLEGALKLKEISYINANGYPAGEMKHGPIALINEQCPTVALCANKLTFDKLKSNLMEVKARNGKVIAIAEECQKGIESIADDVFYVPQTVDELASIPTVVATQLLAYNIAKERGADIDQPRNLAKSVTVE